MIHSALAHRYPNSHHPGTKGGGTRWIAHRLVAPIALSVAGLTACGGGEDPDTTTTTPISDQRTDAISSPITPPPSRADAVVELGPISGGVIQFQTLSGKNLASLGSASDGSLVYNPATLIKLMGTDEWAVAYVSGGYDTDADDNGVTDPVRTQVLGSFRVLIPRLIIQSGKKIIVGPRAGIVTETLLARVNPQISIEALDHIARQTGTTKDSNADGVINYADLLSAQMSTLTDVSSITPAASGYITSVHTGDTAAKMRALSNVAKTENHLLLSIVPDPNGTHTPALRIRSISGGSILITFDLSSPHPNNQNTKTYTGEVVIPMQNNKIYFREQFVLNGQTILGKVMSFDLMHDWTELSQTGLAYKTLSASTTTTSGNYGSTAYRITAQSNTISPGYTYPKLIDCQVGSTTTTGCQFGPYLAWSPAHEVQIQTLITNAIQAYVDQSKPINLIDIYRNAISYGGQTYTIRHTWTRSSTNTRIFPVTITVDITRKNGTIYTSTRGVNDQSSLTLTSNQLEIAAREYIDNDPLNRPAPTYPKNYQIPSNPVSYRGQSYILITTMNITGTSDYPATVSVKYTTPTSSSNTTQTLTANSASELTSIQTERINDAKARIDIAVDADQYPAGATETITNTTSYGGGSYRTVFTYSLNPGQDYPGYIDTYITYSNGQSNKLTIQIDNANQKYTYATNIEAQARQQLDNYPLQPANTITSDGPYSYGSRGSNYTYKAKYNRTNTNTNYPALVWIEYHPGNGGLLDTRTTYGLMIANNWQEKENMKATLANWVRGQMIASAPQDTGDMERGIGGIGELWTRLALSKTGSKVFDILPLSTAQAAPTNPSIVISATRTSLSRVLTSGIWTVNFLGNTGSPVVTYSKPITGKPNIGGKDKEALLLKELMNTIQMNAEKINMIREICISSSNPLYGAGSISECQITTARQTQINSIEQDIQGAMGKYLQAIGEAILPNVASTANYMYGLGDGAASSMYALRDLSMDVLDGTSIQQITDWYKTKMYPYFYENGFDFMKYWGDESRIVLGFGSDIVNLIKDVITFETDPYRRGYLIGSIGSSIAMGSMIGTVADAAMLKIKSIAQIIASLERIPNTAKKSQLIQVLKAKIVQDVVSKFANVSTVEDIQSIANINATAITRSNGSANILIGTEETSQGIVNILKSRGWKIDSNTTTPSIVYYSPDGLQKINVRTISSSINVGYETRVTIDLFRNFGSGLKPIPGKYEVKFVFPKK